MIGIKRRENTLKLQLRARAIHVGRDERITGKDMLDVCDE
jgi:hypothetical protein